MIEEIGNIDIIIEIKEKIKNNIGYLHPCNKEFQEDIKIYGFGSGHDFITWMQNNGILKNPSDIDSRSEYRTKYLEKQKHNNKLLKDEQITNYYRELEDNYGKEFVKWAIKNRNIIEKKIISLGCKSEKEYRDKMAQINGFKNDTERRKVNSWNNGVYFPLQESEGCPKYFGEYIAENYIIKTFKDAIPAPINNPGFDWTCNKGLKIQCMSRCLSHNGNWSGWIYAIAYNNIADYFLISAWDNRTDLKPLHIWIFNKNDIVRGEKFWRRTGLSITNKPYKLIELCDYEVYDKLEKLIELCK